jgi:hypothetical protein
MSEPQQTTAPQANAETLVHESDWLASRPFFYNLRTCNASHNINHVIDFANLEFDPEGLNDYLDFGYCVFEHTPVKDVRLLRFSSRLWQGPTGLRIEQLADPAVGWLEKSSTVDEVLEVAAALVNDAAQAAEGDIVVPTSGGLDSRFIHLAGTVVGALTCSCTCSYSSWYSWPMLARAQAWFPPSSDPRPSAADAPMMALAFLLNIASLVPSAVGADRWAARARRVVTSWLGEPAGLGVEALDALSD